MRKYKRFWSMSRQSGARNQGQEADRRQTDVRVTNICDSLNCVSLQKPGIEKCPAYHGVQSPQGLCITMIPPFLEAMEIAMFVIEMLVMWIWSLFSNKCELFVI